jgi:hypothetical protein
MSVQRYKRKPEPRYEEDQVAARYEPGKPLDDLRAVARMAGDEAEVIEAVFPSGKRAVLAWFLRYDDHHPARPDYAFVEAGDYLAYSPGGCALYSSDEANWRQFYELVPEAGQ